MKRTTYCGLVNEDLLNEEVVLKGWIDNRRDLGGIIFLDLRDREGIVQIMADADISEDAWKVADSLRSEYVVEVRGKVIKRDAETVNPELATGELEIEAAEIKIINKSKALPFNLNASTNVSEEIRGHYRYLDLRQDRMQKNMYLRHKVTQAIRNYLDKDGFIDIETPYLTQSTPEGARDYVVPSRVHEGSFYALPQSPQLFKQLLMSGGFDRYYQIVRCFRDEDLRGDRQPEFTQLDIETTFMDDEEIQEIIEQLLAYVMKESMGVDIELPIQRMTYDDAINIYGTDKPDLRFDMPLVDLSEDMRETDFKVFSGTVEKGGMVKAINAKGAADNYTRKDIDEGLLDYVKIYGAKGLAWIKVDESGLTGPIAKFFKEKPEEKAIVEKLNAEAGDLILFVADQADVVHDALGHLRNRLAKELGLIDNSVFKFVWIVDWPLLEYDEDEKRYVAAHHPFTMPKEEDVDKLVSAPEEVYADAYDIVLNGYEIGGGSLRIYQREVQENMFKALGFTAEEYEEQFGFLLEAMDYGFPPHGGIAFGLDRLVMILAGEENIREVIAFPKNSNAMDPMTKAPSVISDRQLEELSIYVDIDEEELD